MEKFLARKYLWIDGKAWPFFIVLVNGVGRLVKTVRNATIKSTMKNYRFTAVLRDGIQNFILSPTVDDNLSPSAIRPHSFNHLAGI